MKCFLLLFLFSQVAQAQLSHSIALQEEIAAASEEGVKRELLHLASLKSIEKFAPEMGYKFTDFMSKLNKRFFEYFDNYKEKKIIEKFGSNYKENLSEAEKKSFSDSMEKERHEAFVKFSRTLDILRSHSITGLVQEADSVWKARVDLNIDKIKLERLFRKILSGESKAFSRIILYSEIDAFNFGWNDLALENDRGFISPLNESWQTWINKNLPSTVEEVMICDSDCLNFYSRWSESHSDHLSIPPEYTDSVFLKINIHLKRTAHLDSLKESVFEWSGRALLQDVNTKRTLGSFEMGNEKRTFRQLEQKALNSALASSIYRSPMTALMQFNRKLEEKIGFNRVTRLVIKGHRNLGDVLAYGEVLKTRGSSLGLEVFLESFTKEEAKLSLFYRGEEKSFTDLLSGIKELKSSHSYMLVNEFTGVHNVIKFITE